MWLMKGHTIHKPRMKASFYCRLSVDWIPCSWREKVSIVLDFQQNEQSHMFGIGRKCWKEMRPMFHHWKFNFFKMNGQEVTFHISWIFSTTNHHKCHTRNGHTMLIWIKVTHFQFILQYMIRILLPFSNCVYGCSVSALFKNCRFSAQNIMFSLFVFHLCRDIEEEELCGKDCVATKRKSSMKCGQVNLHQWSYRIKWHFYYHDVHSDSIQIYDKYSPLGKIAPKTYQLWLFWTIQKRKKKVWHKSIHHTQLNVWMCTCLIQNTGRKSALFLFLVQFVRDLR